MAFLAVPSHRRPRSVLVLVLIITLVLVATLAYQAQDAARSHRKAAEQALRDYAAFAAWQVVRRGQDDIRNGIALALRPVYHGLSEDRGRLPTLAEIQAAALREASKCSCPPLEPLRFVFRFDLGSGELLTIGPADDAEIRERVPDLLRGFTEGAAGNPEEFGMFLRGAEDGHRIIGYVVMRGASGAPAAVFGLETGVAALEPVFQNILDHTALLPPSLTRGLSVDSLLSLAVLDPAGGVVYRSAPARGTPLSAESRMNGRMGGLAVRAELRPEIAKRLVIGGLPRSRLPMLLGLLTLAVALLLIATWQLRREYELTRLREAFVAGVSHELRTPLAQIRMFAETLLLGRTRSDLERRRSLEIIDREARRLAQLVDNILHYSRAERRALRVTPQPTDLAAQIREVADGFALLAAQKRMELRIDVEPRVAAPVDPGALKQILLNLLENALKYGPAGQQVMLGLALYGDLARIWVDDEGPGVAPTDRSRIFEPFFRTAAAVRSSTGGSGIGLAVVRELVALHGGRIRVEDAPVGGARFIVELPGAHLLPAEPLSVAADAGSAVA